MKPPTSIILTYLVTGEGSMSSQLILRLIPGKVTTLTITDPWGSSEVSLRADTSAISAHNAHRLLNSLIDVFVEEARKVRAKDAPIPTTLEIPDTLPEDL